MKLSLLRPKSGQSRHEARHLVVPNQQRVTLSGVILASTRRDGAIFTVKRYQGPSSFVSPSSGTEVNRLFNQLNDAFSAVLAKKMALVSDSFISVNRPLTRLSP